MLIKNPKFLVLAVTALSVNACQQKTKTKEVVRAELPWYQQPNTFQKENYGEAVKLSRGTTCLRTDAQYLTSTNLLGIYSGAATETIIDATYGFDEAGKDIVLLNSNEKTTAKAEQDDLFVCNPQSNSANLEGVAAYAASDIKVATDWYKTVTGDTLPALQLHVHPLETKVIYERLTDEDKAALLKQNPKAQVGPFRTQEDAVDNAYWTLDYSDESGDPVPLIAVYPHSKTTNEGVNPSPPLWELPFVLRHEYGHHVFYKLLTPLLGSAQVHLKETLAANPNHHSTRAIKKHSVFAQDKGKAPVIDTASLFGALNEGFADMYSFYASGQKMPGIEKATCFLKTRDPASLEVGGLSVKKVFNADLVDLLFNPASTVKGYTLADDAPCNGFNVLEIHDLGAVFAYTVDKIFDSAPSVVALTDANAKAKEKTRLALAWLGSLNDSLNLADSGPATLLAQILEGAAVTAQGSRTLSPDSSVCKAVQTQFPVFQTRWKDKALGACFTAL